MLPSSSGFKFNLLQQTVVNTRIWITINPNWEIPKWELLNPMIRRQKAVCSGENALFNKLDLGALDEKELGKRITGRQTDGRHHDWS